MHLVDNKLNIVIPSQGSTQTLKPYKSSRGETLATIAAANRTTVDEMRFLNPGTFTEGDPNSVVSPGTLVLVPA